MGRWRIRLRGIGPHIEGKFWESESVLRVGRLETAEVCLNDTSISRRHAEVVATEEGWVVRDLGSTNGTYLNGLKIGRTNRKIRLRDVLQCGNLVLVVAVLEEEVQPGVETPSVGMQVEAATKNSWEKALEVVAFDETRRPHAGDRMLTLLRAGHHLGHIANQDELLRSVLEDTISALEAQRGSIVLHDEATDQLHLRAVSTGDKETGGRYCFSRSLAHRSFNRGESLLCRDVSNNPELLMANSIADGTMSSIICALLRSPRKRLGVLHLDRGPFQDPFTQEDLHLADALAASVSAAIESAQLLQKQKDLYVSTVTALAQAVEMRDAYTGAHTERVTRYSLMLADQLGLTRVERDLIERGTPLHDIGKISIKDEILQKPGKLTLAEFEEMKLHTIKGAEIIRTIPDLLPIVPIVRNHHERWDGNGYPDMLAGDQIPRLARIVAVADSFDAMTSDRPYRAGMPLPKAFEEIANNIGRQFDPDVARAFLHLREAVEQELTMRSHSSVDTIMPGVLDVLNDSDTMDGIEPPQTPGPRSKVVVVQR